MTKRAKDLVKYAESLGNEVVRRTGSGHVLVRHRVTGHQTTISSTPSEPRGDVNKRKDLWRGAQEGKGGEGTW